ncbi:hypothetical protein [Flavobacterium algicola]|uniref:hypothetical protein n=1 Tax=Flavobacterium algicola TaxID=556529 RepID=UPI001EFE3BB6|nr:hypothetical protein [Flavobacterium algicola]MCG9792073.1 hypothetical protein [Flavobacterium algicola]
MKIYPTNVREQDNYLTEEIKEKCQKFFVPASIDELTLGLSSVTASFYGLGLKHISEEFGKDATSRISKKIFYDLGKMKAKQCRDKMPQFPYDTTALAMTTITAIYTSNPEYVFTIMAFSPEKTVLKLEGVDRYLKILAELGIEDQIEMPTLLTFMEGINDELNLKADIEYEIDIDEENNTTNTTYTFTQEVTS